jgi:polyhydroxybutyrate depolymerase
MMGGDPNPSPACGKPGMPTGFTKTNHLTVAGADRTYSIYVPTAYDGTKPYPVVYVLHGDGGNGAGIRSGFNVEGAASDGAIFVYPDGANQTWDTDHWFDNNNADVPFLDALFQSIATNYCTDTKRLFVTGFSRGAYMSNQLGCWRGGTIRAISPNSGGGPYGDGSNSVMYDNNGMLVCPGMPIPSLMIHGDSDATVNISEGQKSLTYWTYADKCMMSTTAVDPSPCQTQNGCSPAPVTFCKIPGLDHTPWSMAPAAVWSFFDSMK